MPVELLPVQQLHLPTDSMGSPISGLIAEAVLQRLERKVFADISLKFWKRYVNDTFVIIQENQLPAFHQLLNTALPGNTFTMEAPTENKLPFLDVLVHQLSSGMLKTSVYRKGTNTIATAQPVTNAAVSGLYLAELLPTAVRQGHVGWRKPTFIDSSRTMATL